MRPSTGRFDVGGQRLAPPPIRGRAGELKVIGALVTALRGNEADLESVLAEPERALLAMKGGPLLATAHLARGAAALGDGRHDDAFQHLWPVFDDNDSAFHRFMRWQALLDLVESAAGSGQTSRLTEVIEDLELNAELVALSACNTAGFMLSRFNKSGVPPKLRNPFSKQRRNVSVSCRLTASL